MQRMASPSATGLGYVSLSLHLLVWFFTCRTGPANDDSSPMNAMTVSLCFTVILASIVIGSTTAYGVFVTLVNSGLLSSYTICIACRWS